MKLQEAVKKYYNHNQKLVAKSWEEFAEVLYKKKEIVLSKQALEEALKNYEEIENLKNKAEIIHRIEEILKNYPKFIVKIEHHRKAKGLSQEKLAFSLNISLKTIQDWEKGKGLEELQQYWELSDILGCKITELKKPTGFGFSIKEKLNIKNLRDIQYLTQENLASLLDVSLITIQNLETNLEKFNHFIQIYGKLAKELNCEINDLIEPLDTKSIEPIPLTKPLPRNSTKKEI